MEQFLQGRFAEENEKQIPTRPTRLMSEINDCDLMGLVVHRTVIMVAIRGAW